MVLDTDAQLVGAGLLDEMLGRKGSSIVSGLHGLDEDLKMKLLGSFDVQQSTKSVDSQMKL